MGIPANSLYAVKVFVAHGVGMVTEGQATSAQYVTAQPENHIMIAQKYFYVTRKNDLLSEVVQFGRLESVRRTYNSTVLAREKKRRYHRQNEMLLTYTGGVAKQEAQNLAESSYKHRLVIFLY